MAKWRVINNNRIQSYSKWVFLWDRQQGVAIKTEVPRRPWTKIDPDFSHWQACEEDDAIPYTFPAGEKPNDAHFTNDNTFMVGDHGELAGSEAMMSGFRDELIFPCADFDDDDDDDFFF